MNNDIERSMHNEGGPVNGSHDRHGKYFIDGKWRTLDEAARHKAEIKELAKRVAGDYYGAVKRWSDEDYIFMYEGTLTLSYHRLAMTINRFKAAVIKHVREGLGI